MMQSATTRTLRSAIQSLLLVLGLWISLTALPLTTPGLADDGMCKVQANMCGCLSCGCGQPGVPERPSCPPGQDVYDDYCLPSCPDGWLRYPGIPGLCTPPCEQGCPEGWDQVPLPTCPDGFHRDLNNPDYCAQDEDRQKYGADCPNGMSYATETGQCEVDCPNGMFRNGNGLCESYYEKECRPGLIRDSQSGRCLPPGVWPPGYQWICLPNCPPGTYRDIYQPTRCVPPPPSCPDGFEEYNERCVPICEEGTTRDPYGYCNPPRCPDGSYPNLRGQCQETECPPGSESVRGQCVPPCEQGFSRDDNGRCTPPDDDCPPDTERFNGQCMPPCERGDVRNEVGECVPPDDGCEPGTELFRGQCVPPCDRGTIRDANGRCVPTGCPQGQIKFNGKCLPRCPPDQLRDNNGRCVCPRGTDTFQGKCVPVCKQGLVRNDNGRCVCPRGTDFFGGKCVPECKVGLQRDKNGRCMPPACGPGLERFQGRCVPQCKESFVRAGNGRCVCPEGARINPNSGRCERVVIERLCPKGFRRNENGECERIVQVPTACKQGFYFDRRRQRCLPIPVEQPEPDQPILRRPTIELNPDVLQQLIPQKRPKPARPAVIEEQPDVDNGANVQKPCPKGFFRDENGRCVEAQ